MSTKVKIGRLETQVPGLDTLLGGGIPEFSFNLIAGTPGSGKTTLAHQIMFSLTTPERKALYFTVLGEPTLKMLRYQQQFPHFDIDKINDTIKFVNLSTLLLERDFKKVLQRIELEVKNFDPGLIFVDSFRSVMRSLRVDHDDSIDLEQFIQRLGMSLTGWEATTFLIGEYLTPETEASPIFTVADGIIWMSQELNRNAMVRKIQIVKMRGQAQSPGLHTFRITNDGLEIFPRILFSPPGPKLKIKGEKRLSTGNPKLDEMMGGGLPIGYSLLVVGPSGSGKTVLATQFLEKGVEAGEPGIIAAFEKSPNQLLSKQLNKLIESGKVGLIDTRALDLSIDETVYQFIEMIGTMKAKRVVIDSLSWYELALAPTFRDNFRESLYRMISALTGLGVTVLMTAELEDRYTDLRFSGYGNAFLADAIVVQRYVEIEGQLDRVIAVVKMRGSRHSKDICLFDVDKNGLVIGERLANVQGILSGSPHIAMDGG